MFKPQRQIFQRLGRRVVLTSKELGALDPLAQQRAFKTAVQQKRTTTANLAQFQEELLGQGARGKKAIKQQKIVVPTTTTSGISSNVAQKRLDKGLGNIEENLAAGAKPLKGVFTKSDGTFTDRFGKPVDARGQPIKEESQKPITSIAGLTAEEQSLISGKGKITGKELEQRLKEFREGTLTFDVGGRKITRGTPEVKTAREKLLESAAGINELLGEEFIQSGDIPTTRKGELLGLKEKQKAEKTTAERLQELTKARFKSQTEGVRGAVKTAFAQGREGVVSAAKTAAPTAAAAELLRKAEELDLRLTSNKRALAEIQKQQRVAVAKDDLERREALIKAEAQIRDAIKEDEADQAKELEKAKKSALGIVNDVGETIGFENLANIPVDSLLSTITNRAALAGITDLAQISQMKQSLLALKQLSQDVEDAKTPAEKEIKRLELEKFRKEVAQIGVVEPTAAQQDFQFFQELQKTNPKAAKRFADLKGFGGKAEADKLKAQLEAEGLRRDLEESAPTPDNVKKFWSLPTTTEFGDPTAFEDATPAIDVVASRGTSVPSPVSGTVVSVAPDLGGFGNQVVVRDSEGNIHRFSHLQRFDVEQGEQIILGQSIGGIGNTGNSLTRQADGTFLPPTDEERAAGRGSHLDYRVRDAAGNNVNPRQFITKPKSEVQRQADAIIESTTLTTSGLSTKDNFRGKVEQELAIRQKEFRDKGDIENVLKASAGGKSPDPTFISALGKGKTVLNQLEELSRALVAGESLKDASQRKDDEGDKLFDSNPIFGWIREKNPWDRNAQEVQAILQGTIPNLARGVFGEVGVLTDRDVELYRKTLPNLKQTGEVQKVIAGLTMRVVRRSLENSLLTQADNGRNVAGNVRFLDELDDKIRAIETNLGIVDEPVIQETRLERFERLKKDRGSSASETENTTKIQEIRNRNKPQT